MSEYIKAFKEAWYSNQNNEEIRFDRDRHASIWENVWKMFDEWVKTQNGYQILEKDLKKRIQVTTNASDKGKSPRLRMDPWLFIYSSNAIKSAIYVKIVMCSTGIHVGVDFDEKEVVNKKDKNIYIHAFRKCFSKPNDDWQIEGEKFSIYKLIGYKKTALNEDALDEDYESDFNNLLQEAIEQYEIVIKEFQKIKDIYNSLWWFSFDCVKNIVDDKACDKFEIQFAKYKEEILTFINDKSKEELCKMPTIRAGLAQKLALKYGIDDNLRRVFKGDGETPRDVKVTDSKGNSEKVKIPRSVSAKTFINKIFDLFHKHYTEENSKDLIIVFKYEGKDLEKSMDYMYQLIGKENIHPYTDSTRQDTASKGTIIHRNCIWAGAPGTGKSFKLNEAANSQFKGNITRVTFHPEYTYYDFVGTYRPKMALVEENGVKKKTIEYDFVPGPFAKMLKKALWDRENEYCLIIEEINRANMAAVFGDVFQLLDRASEDSKEGSVKKHESEYAICPSEELYDFLVKEIEGKEPEKKLLKEQLRLPANLYLWATMNSADQGVFPMDTAFKRRWSFKNMDIDPDEVTKDDWDKIRRGINELLLTNHVQEDKLMGYYFLKEEERKGENLETALKEKVMLYLFEDAAKPFRKNVFKESMNTCAKLRKELKLEQKQDLDVFKDKLWDENGNPIAKTSGDNE